MSELFSTPGQTVGPFFHHALPYPRASELVAPSSLGAICLHGIVYDGAGAPVPDALIEIRQAGPTGEIPLIGGSLTRQGRFTGWGRAATDSNGHYEFTTLEPGRAGHGAPFFAVVVFARGLLHRLFTRAYLPEPGHDGDALLRRLEPGERATLVAGRDADGGLRFDIHLQGPSETVFLDHRGLAGT